MQKADSLQGKWSNIVFFSLALLVIVADQLSKIWVRSNLAIGEPLPPTGLFRLIHVRNTGAAFGLFQDHSFLLTIVALVGVTAILIFALYFYRHFPFYDRRLGNPALGLILGGTIGNLIDRLNQGFVTDFIAIGIWPAFNVADSAVVVGVILFVYRLLFLARAPKGV